MLRILVIDDNKSVLNFLRIFLLQSRQCEVTVLHDSREAYALLEKESFDILLLDMDMPHVTGLDILRHISANKIMITTIVLTGVEDVDLAISAMKLGTHDYMLKPIDEKKLLQAIDNAVKISPCGQDETKGASIYDCLKHKDLFKNIITKDEKMFKIFLFVEKYANTDNSVLIWGDSGTGKELIAEAIHKISDRRNNKFVAVNAGSFAQELFASEFFGHEKGAFTGAVRDKKGFLEEAQGGTLFLDEIGELALPMQVKLLRVIQEEEFYKIGSTQNIKSDVRIIAATNKNLFDEISKGNFRKDLFFRLNINSISLPPLIERGTDIELLADHFLHKFNKKYNKQIKKISAPVMSLLRSYAYPGNVRELMNILNSAIIIETGHELKRKSLPNYFLENFGHSMDPADGASPSSLEEMEKKHIKKILEFTNMNKTKASELLGISRVNLIAKIKKYKLEQE